MIIPIMFAFLVLAIVMTVPQVSIAEENKTHNVDIVFGSGDVENGRFYSPPIIKIKVGDSISWLNLDKDPHTVTDGTPRTKWANIFDSGIMRQNVEFKHLFDEPGEYPYLCRLHPWMIGRVLVEDPLTNSVPVDKVDVLQKLNVFIKSEKQSYHQNEVVTFTVEVLGAGNRANDPDQIHAKFGMQELLPVTLNRVDVGEYVYSVSGLQPGSYNLSVDVSKEGFAAGHSLLTIHVMEGPELSTKHIELPELSASSVQQQYFVGDVVDILGRGSAPNSHSIVLQVFNSNDKLFTRAQTQADSEGSFVWSFRLPTDAPIGEWIVRIKESDRLVTASFDVISNLKDEEETSRAGEADQLTGSTEFVPERISVSEIALTNDLGTKLEKTNVNTSVLIRTTADNNEDKNRNFAYIVQVKDSTGIVVKLDTVEGTVSGKKSITLAVSWTPEAVGIYELEVFVWKSLSEPEPLLLNTQDMQISVVA